MGTKAKEFGTRLKNLLENKNMTQKELAEKLFIQPSAVSNYVQGTRLPNFDVITSIAKYFNTSVDYLLGNRTENGDFKNPDKLTSQFFIKRIQRLLKENYMSELDLCKKINIASNDMIAYTSGKQLPRIEILQAMAEALNVDVQYLLGADEIQKIDGYMKLDQEKYKIPILGSVHAGMPTLISDDNIVGYINIDDSYKKYGELFALKIKGDSMQPRLFDGDIVIVKRTPDVESGKIAAVIINGDEATVKKIMKSQSGIVLIPLNSSYDILTFSNDDIISKPVIVVGQIIEVRGKI